MISVSRHERILRTLYCAVSNKRPVTLHHAHGGSVKDAGWHVGIGQKQNPFLQIPLHEDFHIGAWGIDSGMGVVTWEKAFGTQQEHLVWVNGQIEDYDIWHEAQAWQEKNRSTGILKL